MKRFAFFSLILLHLFACNDDDGNEPIQIPEEGRQVFILNEGNFQFGNASISNYTIEDQQIQEKLFLSNNSGRPIGDVIQSMQIIGDTAYIVVNNSSKIEVVDINSFKSIGLIAPFNSPRYLLPINGRKAYISDLYEGKISIIDIQNLDIIGTIETGGWTEEMVLEGNKAFVCHMEHAEVLVIDVETDRIIDRISTAIEPQHIRKDKNGNIWISCSGGFEEGMSALIQIDPINHSVLKKLEASSLEQSLGELEVNAAMDQLYYFNLGGLYRISIHDSTLPAEPLIEQGSHLFYGLGVDQQTDEIYISDAIDFQQRGVVFRHDSNGVELDRFKVGIIPGDFVFYR